MSCEDLPGRAVPQLPSPHIPHQSSEHASYNSIVPTSGPHVPFTITAGVYREAIAPEIQVHALEHGHVLVQYPADSPDSIVKEAEGIARRFPRDVVIAPSTALRTGIALTAWGRIELLDGVRHERIERFVESLADRYDHGWTNGAVPCGA